jgi:hypothetical protein
LTSCTYYVIEAAAWRILYFHRVFIVHLTRQSSATECERRADAAASARLLKLLWVRCKTALLLKRVVFSHEQTATLRQNYSSNSRKRNYVFSKSSVLDPWKSWLRSGESSLHAAINSGKGSACLKLILRSAPLFNDCNEGVGRILAPPDELLFLSREYIN